MIRLLDDEGVLEALKGFELGKFDGFSTAMYLIRTMIELKSSKDFELLPQIHRDSILGFIENAKKQESLRW